jgi:hypothetical protein
MLGRGCRSGVEVMATRGWEGVKASDVKGAKRPKYGATKTTVDRITFDSKKEATRYGELRVLERTGEIRDLRLQPKFPLWVHEGLVEHGPIRIGEYRAEFAYEAWTGTSVGDRHLHPSSDKWKLVVEDVKGFKTPLYRWKKKHVEAQYGIQIREV